MNVCLACLCLFCVFVCMHLMCMCISLCSCVVDFVYLYFVVFVCAGVCVFVFRCVRVWWSLCARHH